MNGRRTTFDWRKIHDGLEARLSRLGSTYEHDRARMQSILLTRSAPLADRGAGASLARLLIFRSGIEKYGLALECAREIARLSQIAVLPGSSADLLGVVNWRGEFVTVFAAAQLLGVGETTERPAHYAIMLRGEEPRFALAVDGLDGIVRSDLSQLQAPDRLGAGTLVRGIAADAVTVLDDSRLLTRMREGLCLT